MSAGDDNPTEDEPLDAASLETAEVYWNRFTEGRSAGFSIKEAIRFAESPADVGELRRLVELKCPLRLLRRIVL